MNRPPTWTMADEGYEQVERFDYFGKPYKVWQKKTNGLDYGKLWGIFRDQFNNQEEKQGPVSFNPVKHQTLIDIENNQL